MLTLSGQQLVTGPAIMLATIAQRCQITAYEYQVVNSLAWLASTTHLATLIVLRHYFLDNRLMRDLRVIAMIINLILLLYTSIMTAASYNVQRTIATVLFLVINYVEYICSLYNQNISPF